MNRIGQWFWWMDRENPRLRRSMWAKLAYSVVWVVGFFLLLLLSQLVINALARFGFMGRTSP